MPYTPRTLTSEELPTGFHGKPQGFQRPVFTARNGIVHAFPKKDRVTSAKWVYCPWTGVGDRSEEIPMAFTCINGDYRNCACCRYLSGMLMEKVMKRRTSKSHPGGEEGRGRRRTEAWEDGKVAAGEGRKHWRRRSKASIGEGEEKPETGDKGRN